MHYFPAGSVSLLNIHYEHLLFSAGHRLNRTLKGQAFQKRVLACCSTDWVQRTLPMHTHCWVTNADVLA